ncbi:DUF4097 family beta strand repeat-containing protein [Streptomyces flavalbus]|uniref:DUF4097 family beta strand repeat-containing protein n=1 Tax=Streptomyces flavalbus TaxID=2665155 RepID=A0ABW2W5S2_9ACTN
MSSSRPRRTAVPVRAAAVAGAVAVLLAGATACGASAEDDSDPEHRTFPVAGGTLTVDSDDSTLEIIAADSNAAGKVEVTRWFQGSVVVGSDPKVTWSMTGDRLKLRVKCSGMVANCAAKHRIEVPRGITVKVEEGDGSVRARGFEDPLEISTGDGSVDVTDSTGPLTVRTGDGSIHADVTSREIRAQTGDGSVDLALGAVPDLVDSRTGDGSVTIALPAATYRVTTQTGDGSVNVSVPRAESSAHVVNARTGDGKVTVRTAN